VKIALPTFYPSAFDHLLQQGAVSIETFHHQGQNNGGFNGLEHDMSPSGEFTSCVVWMTITNQPHHIFGIKLNINPKPMSAFTHQHFVLVYTVLQIINSTTWMN
jgi:hypothetical protein